MGPPVDVRTTGEFNISNFISNCLILNFSILQKNGSDSTEVSVLDLKTVLVLWTSPWMNVEGGMSSIE